MYFSRMSFRRLGALLWAPGAISVGFLLHQKLMKPEVVPELVFARSRRHLDDEVKSNPKRRRFEDFATIQINSQLYMTPVDFLESITEARPRKSAYRLSYSAAEIESLLIETTPEQGKDLEKNEFINIKHAGILLLIRLKRLTKNFSSEKRFRSDKKDK